jgi:hypothetical protein
VSFLFHIYIGSTINCKEDVSFKKGEKAMNYMDTNHRMPRDMAADKDVLAMAFVNSQKITSVYDVDTGFTCGTIYPCLNKPLSTGGAWR